MSKKTILIVDDSQVAILTEKLVVGQSGKYEVRTASDGEEAVRAAIEEPPDLIVMDVVMPKLDGFGACRKLRSNEATRGIPIIMVTTRGEPKNVEEGYAAGCNDYVTKPVNSGELLKKIGSLIG